jgi:putative oxidoreductase
MMDFTGLSRWQPYALAILRIVVALLFIEHATIKLFGFPPGGMPGPQPIASLLGAAAIIEMVTGVLVLLGVWTRLAAFLASGEMAVAYFMFHGSKGFWPAVNLGEAAILFCFTFLYLAAAGPGAWSIDGARMRNAPIR